MDARRWQAGDSWNACVIFPLPSLAGPLRERQGGQARIEIAAVPGDFGADPWGKRGDFIGVIEFDLGDDQPFVGSMKDVDFPRFAVKFDEMTGFIDDGGVAKCEQCAGVVRRDGILEFISGNAPGCTFDGDPSICPGQTDSDAASGLFGKVTLRHAGARAAITPRVVAKKEFAFDF